MVGVYEAYRQHMELWKELFPDKVISIKYEDLVRDPVTALAQIYEQLELGDFAPVRPAIERYASRSRNYKTNKYELSDETQKQIERRWQMAFERFGYPVS